MNPDCSPLDDADWFCSEACEQNGSYKSFTTTTEVSVCVCVSLGGGILQIILNRTMLDLSDGKKGQHYTQYYEIHDYSIGQE